MDFSIMTPVRTLRPARGLAWLLAAGSCVGAHAAYDCASLIAVTSADARMSSASLVAAPSTIGGAAVSVPMCRVQGVARPSNDSQIKFEVWLPPEVTSWTGRLKVNGTGGYNGAIPYARLAQDIGEGFVTAGSNMGHDGGESAFWTLGHPEKVKDWGLRAHQSVAIAAKKLAAAAYGRPVSYSYFEGCSNGGRQAMMVAQNYPKLFDGIIAGAPSMFYPDLLMWLMWTGKSMLPTSASGPEAIGGAKRQAITQRVLQACDGLDGVVDGQITNPRMCRFNIDTMGPAGDGTLSYNELQAVKHMYGGTHRRFDDLSSELRYPGASLGSEADWAPTFADNGGYGSFIGHYVYAQSAPYDWRTNLDWDGAYDHIKGALTPVTAAPSPDLRRFVANGGKMIQVHGWNDAVVPPDGSIDYFYALTQFEKLKSKSKAEIDRKVAALTTQGVVETADRYGPAVQQYHRLFMLPATGHCGDSTGPNAIGGGMPEPPANYRDADHHTVRAIIRWVEQGVAPDKLIATKFDAYGNPERARPVCPYPAEAVYKGSGDLNDAASFSCQTVNGHGRMVNDADLTLIRSSMAQRALLLPNR